MAILQVWSALPFESGAYCHGGIPRWTTAAGKEARGSAPTFTLRAPVDNNGAIAYAREGAILRTLSDSRGEQFWVVTLVDQTEGVGGGSVSITCGSIRQLLATRGLIREQPIANGPFVYSVDPGRRSPTDHLTRYVFTNLSADGLTGWAIGTIDYTAPVTLGTLTRARRGAVLDQLETQTGYTFVPRLVYSGSTLTGVALDLLEDPASALETRLMEVGGAITSLTQTQELTNAPTVAIPFTASGGPLEHPAFEIGAVTGAGPYWVTLLDPEGGPAVVREDDQFVGAYLLNSAGTTHQITDSRASDSAVSVASNSGLSAGGIVSIVTDTAGRPLTEITSPSGLASSRGRVVADVGTQAVHAKNNWCPNPLFLRFADVFTPEDWADEGGTFNVGEYPRDTPATVTGVLTNGVQSAGAGGVTFKNAPANARFYSNEYLVVASAPFRVGNNVAVADGSGNGSIVFASGTLAAPVADGQPITFLGAEPTRPTSFPDEPVTTNVMRLLTNSADTAIPPTASALRMQSSPVTIKYAAGWETLRLTADFTIVGSNTTLGNTDAGAAITDDITTATTRGLPAVMLVDPAGPTRLAYAICPTSVDAAELSHQQVSCTYTLSTDKTVAVALLSSNLGMWQGCRGVALELRADTETEAPYQFSGSNQLFHRAQDVLAQRTTAGRYRITGVDLRALLMDGEPLVMGQWLRVRSELGDATLRIVTLEYAFGDAGESMIVEVGTVAPTLTQVTVTI